MGATLNSVGSDSLSSNSTRGSRFEALEQRQLFAAPTADLPFGQTDTSFGTSGHALVAASNFEVEKLITAGGYIYEIGDNSIARFTAAGKVDKTFGTNGVTAVLGGDFISAAVSGSNQLYTLVTSTSQQNTRNTILVRYTAAGQADGTYATGGSTTVVDDSNFTPVDLAVQSDGKVVVAGTESTNSGKGAAMRLLRVGTDGMLDSSFGTSGSFQANLGAGTSLAPVVLDKVIGLRILSGGDLLIGGGTVSYAPTNFNTSSANTESDLAIAHITSAGVFDTSFGTGGVVKSVFDTQAQVTAYTSGNTSSFPSELPTHFDARSDGSTVFAGIKYGTPTVADVAAFTAAGSLSFNKAVPIDPLGNINAADVKALPDGRSVLFAPSSNSNTGFAVTAIGTDGTIGNTVLTDDLNTATTDLYSGQDGAIAIASNGQLLIGGIDNNYSDLLLQQLNASTADAARPDNFAHGTVNSIVAANNGYVHLAYYDSTNADLVYVRRLRNGLWSKPIVIDAKPGAGAYLSIGVDAKQNPFIAYYDRKSKTLKLATSTDLGLHFTTRVLDQSGDVGQYVDVVGSTSLAASAPALAYYDKTNGNLKLAVQNSKGVWAVSTVDSKGDVGQNAAITYSNANHLQIAYYDATAKIVKFAGQDSTGKFQFKTVGGATAGVESVSIAVTGTDQPAVVYHDLASGDLRLSAYTTGPKFIAHTIAVRTGQAAVAVPPQNNGDPLVYTYSKSSNSLLAIADPLHSRVDTSVGIGGSGLSVSIGPSGYQAIAAFIDPTSGILEVRPLPYS